MQGPYDMFLLGVSVLELDIHPDHNNGPDPHTMRMSSDQSIQKSYPYYHMDLNESMINNMIPYADYHDQRKS